MAVASAVPPSAARTRVLVVAVPGVPGVPPLATEFEMARVPASAGTEVAASWELGPEGVPTVEGANPCGAKPAFPPLGAAKVGVVGAKPLLGGR